MKKSPQSPRSLFPKVQFSILYCDNAVPMIWLGLGTNTTWLGLGTAHASSHQKYPVVSGFYMLSSELWLGSLAQLSPPRLYPSCGSPIQQVKMKKMDEKKVISAERTLRDNTQPTVCSARCHLTKARLLNSSEFKSLLWSTTDSNSVRFCNPCDVKWQLSEHLTINLCDYKIGGQNDEIRIQNYYTKSKLWDSHNFVKRRLVFITLFH